MTRREYKTLVFFVLSKILDVLLSPLAWAILLVGAGLLLRERRPRASRGCLGGALAVLYLFSIEPVALGLWSSLEADPPKSAPREEPYDVVVLLGGLVEEGPTELHGLAMYNENVERLLVTRELLADGRAKKVLLSGGAASGRSVIEARILADELARMGIARDRMVLEEISRNTRENAVEAKRIADREGWQSMVVVTSAFHMRRALGCFRKVGLSPDTLPVDFRTYRFELLRASFLPRTGALNTSAVAIRELFGRVVYRLQGYAE
jgi:uncharacterized SAM-binding protein YcdF (DUF218 family)